MCTKQIISLFAVSFLLVVSISTSASVGFSTVNIVPAEPAISDFVHIEAGGWTGYAMNEFLTGSQIGRTGTTISADYYFVLEIPEGGVVLPIAGSWDSVDTIGYLPVGEYTLVAKTWLTESTIMPEYLTLNMYQLTDQRTIYFQVVPEPAMFLLLGLSVCAGYLKKTR